MSFAWPKARSTESLAVSASKRPPMPMGAAQFLEPTAPAVPTTATNKEQHDDNDQNCRGIHVLFSIGYPYGILIH
jgi:hypothetical protein